MTLARSITSAAFAALLGWTPQALAAPFTYDSYSVLNNQTVQLVDPALGFNETGGSGQITLQGGTMPGLALATWCVDIPDMLLGSGAFSAVDTLTGDPGRMVNALLSNASPYLSSSYDASAALQIAIWKVEYGAGLTVTTPGSTTVLALADSWVADVSGSTPLWTADPAMQVSVFRADGANQDQAFLTQATATAVPAPTAVPEPASAAVLLCGLMGLGALRRRRRMPG